MLYVNSRYNEKALIYISLRSDSNSENPYTDVEDIFVYLKTVFYNSNWYIEALIAYYNLKMKPKDAFTDFIAEFLQLVDKVKIVADYRKNNLFNKLSYLL